VALSVPIDGDVTNSLITVIGALTVLLVVLLGIATKSLSYAKTAAGESSMANQAVNNVGPGAHRLYDQVVHINEKISALAEAQEDFTQKGWRHLPSDIGDALALTVTIRQLQEAVANDKIAHDEIKTELNGLMNFMKRHDEWERLQKWADRAEDRPLD